MLLQSYEVLWIHVIDAICRKSGREGFERLSETQKRAFTAFAKASFTENSEDRTDKKVFSPPDTTGQLHKKKRPQNHDFLHFFVKKEEKWKNLWGRCDLRRIR